MKQNISIEKKLQSHINKRYTGTGRNATFRNISFADYNFCNFELDGVKFVGCEFINCKIPVPTKEDIQAEDCVFNSCLFVLNGRYTGNN